MFQKSVRALALLAAAAAVLGGCQADRTPDCPTMTALVPTSEASVFVPGMPPDPTNLLYRVEIVKVDSSCDLDKKTSDADVSLEVHFRATRAPSGNAAGYSVPYFVAVTEGTDKVLLKKQFKAQVSFEPGQTSVDFTDSIASTQVNPQGEKKAYDYQVLVGLQLTKEQLEYNNRRIGQ